MEKVKLTIPIAPRPFFVDAMLDAVVAAYDANEAVLETAEAAAPRLHPLVPDPSPMVYRILDAKQLQVAELTVEFDET